MSGDPQSSRRLQQLCVDSPELRSLLAAAQEARLALSIAPSSATRARHEQMLRDAARELGAPQAARGRPDLGTRRLRRLVLRPVLVFAIVLALAAPATLAFAAKALPGEPLYTTKLAVENAQLTLERDFAGRARLHLEFAQRRVWELRQLTSQGDGSVSADDVAQAVGSLTAHQRMAAQALTRLDREKAGPLEKQLAAGLQTNVRRLSKLVQVTGCDGAAGKPECAGLLVAISVSTQTLEKVEKAPAEAPKGTGEQRGQDAPGGSSSPGEGSSKGGVGGGSQTPPAQSGGSQPGDSGGAGRGGEPDPDASASISPGDQRGDRKDQNGSGNTSTDGGNGSGASSSGSSPEEPKPSPSPGPETEVAPGGAPSEQEPREDSALPVAIDIKPRDSDNSVNLQAQRVIAVAILTTDGFDAGRVDPASVCFGKDPSNPEESDCTEVHGKGHMKDVDGDGDLDLVLHFDTAETGIGQGDSQACLAGKTSDGRSIRGCDAIKAQ